MAARPSAPLPRTASGRGTPPLVGRPGRAMSGACRRSAMVAASSAAPEASMEFEHLTVDVPGGRIFATRRGAGPAALLLHGGPGIGAEYLINGVLPQQRGLEPSTLEGPRDVETHVADMIAVLDGLGWDRAWLIGHAWGGHLAMHIAVAHPERVTGLILFETLGAVPDGGGAELVVNMVARLT